MADAHGATLERVAQGAALLALCASLIAGATLFFPWHTFDRIPPRAVTDRFHIDNRVYGALPREEVPEQHDFAICRGLEHLQIGGWSIVILLTSALLAGLAWRAKTKWGNVSVSLGSVIMCVILAWLGIVAPLLSHLFETQGPTRLAEKVFDAALTAGVQLRAGRRTARRTPGRTATAPRRRYKPWLNARSHDDVATQHKRRRRSKPPGIRTAEIQRRGALDGVSRGRAGAQPNVDNCVFGAN